MDDVEYKKMCDMFSDVRNINLFSSTRDTKYLSALTKDIYNLAVSTAFKSICNPKGIHELAMIILKHERATHKHTKATVYCIDSSKYTRLIEETFSPEKDLLMLLIEREPDLSRIAEISCHGDILEDQSISAYRGNSWMMVSKDPKFELVPLSNYIDEHGSPSEIFKCITEFPLDYWTDMNSMSITGIECQDYWHSDDPPIYCDSKTIINEMTDARDDENGKSIMFTFRGLEYTILNITLKNFPKVSYLMCGDCATTGVNEEF
jgi:hypothetical protein